MAQRVITGEQIKLAIAKADKNEVLLEQQLENLRAQRLINSRCLLSMTIKAVADKFKREEDELEVELTTGISYGSW